MSLRGTLLQGQSMPGVTDLYIALARALANIASTVMSFSAIPGSECESPASVPDTCTPLAGVQLRHGENREFEDLMYFKPLIFSQLWLQNQFKVICVQNLGT